MQTITRNTSLFIPVEISLLHKEVLSIKLFGNGGVLCVKWGVTSQIRTRTSSTSRSRMHAVREL